ncbi:hypothetical protein SAMN02745704_02461 [Paucidesulfovibrio gracilis DSM 16080]|uniref:Uncharacterized protein n=1 Tax=Paucidesulfovibrio gracilis DSM 16080 TaxID=1121449 RepID=A0A1T4XU84_9BACT|nr:C4-type zinc ribbon domain-containing protein [Paucidesulfovibrio gracilis]SKA93122.1 hypothetical protein SAMN02745704_02461 [Paucidesulfovibrio gracilis DSM 16080]
MYQKQIEQLVILQSVDDEIIGLREELEAAPRELADLEQRLESFNTRVQEIDEKVETLGEKQKRLDFEIEEDAGKVKKSKNKLMMASNTKEYHAMMREMDSLEKLNRMREEERVTVVEELAAQQDAKTELDKEMGELREQCEEKRATLQERVQKTEKRLESLDKKRKKAGKVVPDPILGRYEFIRSRLSHPVIVPVTEGVCGGCNIMIPPQIYNELQKGKQILSCPNCQRLIYWVEHTPESLREAE